MKQSESASHGALGRRGVVGEMEEDARDTGDRASGEKGFVKVGAVGEAAKDILVEM